jgi:hypothetical protein
LLRAAACQDLHGPWHELPSPNSGARSRDGDTGREWQDILKALESGVAKPRGDALTADERLSVARCLAEAGPDVVPEMTGFCAAGAKPAPSKSF